MGRPASWLVLALVVAWLAVPAFAADEGQFGTVSSEMAADAGSIGFDITGRFDKAGGAVTVAEIPAYVDPQQGLVMSLNVIAKAGSRLIEQCRVGEEYPIEVVINGSTSRTTAGRCKAFLKNPCAEGICAFWVAPS
jgi:hypothetical protein